MCGTVVLALIMTCRQVLQDLCSEEIWKHCSHMLKLIWSQSLLCLTQNKKQQWRQKQPLHSKCDQEEVVGKAG